MKTLIISFLSLMPVLVSAQDVLYKTDNTKKEVKVTEVGSTTIKYKVFSNPDGPLYTIAKADVALIVYQNGQHEAFKTAPVNVVDPIISKKEKRFLQVTENKNVVFLNTIEFLNSGIGISYLHEFGDGKFEAHVPFATSYSTPGMDNALDLINSYSNYKLSKTNYDIGLGLYFNTSGKKAITHFIGPLIRNAQYSGAYNSYNYETFTSSQKTFTMNETSIMINNGFLYRLTPRFNMMINFAVGGFVDRKITKESSDPGNYNQLNINRGIALHAGFHFGYRF